jgi:hypothetical protein
MGKQLLCLRELSDGLQTVQLKDPAFMVPEMRMAAEQLVAKVSIYIFTYTCIYTYFMYIYVYVYHINIYIRLRARLSRGKKLF